VTAYARSADRSRALRSGFQMHLAKPVDPSELMAATAALVNRSPVSE
jgi:CheY-like chemotaxis protein